MTKKIFLFLPVLAAMVLSCSTKGESDLRTIAIDLKHCPQLEEFVTNERIVSLEMKEECLIGKIDKICIDSIYFYVMDKNNKAVFVFDQ